MLPVTENIDDLILDFEDTDEENTKTFSINFNENIMMGVIDEVEALKQSIYITLNTEADQYIIYPYTFGIKTVDLFGKPSYYVMAVLPERIKEALLSDDRITNVSDFDFEVQKNKIHATFVVNTIYGNINERMVVMY